MQSTPGAARPAGQEPKHAYTERDGKCPKGRLTQRQFFPTTKAESRQRQPKARPAQRDLTPGPASRTSLRSPSPRSPLTCCDQDTKHRPCPLSQYVRAAGQRTVTATPPTPRIQPPRPCRAPTSAPRTAPLPPALRWTALAFLRTRVGGPAPQARACGLPTPSAPRLRAAGSEHARSRLAAAKSEGWASQTAVPALGGGGSPQDVGALACKAKSWTSGTPMAARGSRHLTRLHVAPNVRS
ncbi:serine/arginine repetitive matrix protein 1-like isoform X1 [Onychomys torridus]|uniref:serine/arginine repetitive matrix protein 1-like isoform X1 n=1 Tax=Onychomys torridus TaxID=38674 RepID=UPI00167FB510|nr:serine/arginine repetitive matrix protein 1-like isoform X1 [Onychomys torridus]